MWKRERIYSVLVAPWCLVVALTLFQADGQPTIMPTTQPPISTTSYVSKNITYKVRIAAEQNTCSTAPSSFPSQLCFSRAVDPIVEALCACSPPTICQTWGRPQQQMLGQGLNRMKIAPAHGLGYRSFGFYRYDYSITSVLSTPGRYR